MLSITTMSVYNVVLIRDNVMETFALYSYKLSISSSLEVAP